MNQLQLGFKIIRFGPCISQVKSISSLILISLALSVFPVQSSYSAVKVDIEYLKSSVSVLSDDIGARNLVHYQALEKSRKFIVNELTSFGYQPIIQEYNVEGRNVANISVILGPDDAERLVVGAHYDSFGDQAGADDNASGVAGLLMLAKLLKAQEHHLKKQIELVAFTLEEPPFFRTNNMGSFVHANQLHEQGIPLLGMISIEMIGYFSQDSDSQNYPLPVMKLAYPDKGNFIAIVSDFNSTSLKSLVAEEMTKIDLAVETLLAPASLAGVDFSDHLNYWDLGYQAVMVTDTAHFRNPHYHQKTDTSDTLNYIEMAKTVEGLYYAILNVVNPKNVGKKKLNIKG